MATRLWVMGCMVPLPLSVMARAGMCHDRLNGRHTKKKRRAAHYDGNNGSPGLCEEFARTLRSDEPWRRVRPGVPTVVSLPRRSATHRESNFEGDGDTFDEIQGRRDWGVFCWRGRGRSRAMSVSTVLYTRSNAELGVIPISLPQQKRRKDRQEEKRGETRR